MEKHGPELSIGHLPSRTSTMKDKKEKFAGKMNLRENQEVQSSPSTYCFHEKSGTSYISHCL